MPQAVCAPPRELRAGALMARSTAAGQRINPHEFFMHKPIDKMKSFSISSNIDDKE
jgi:hypothetical protein